MNLKTIRIGIYALSVTALLAGVALVLSIGGGHENLEDLTDATGVVSGICCVFLMALFAAVEILKRKWYPSAWKRSVVFATRQLTAFHAPVTALGMAFLAVHLASYVADHGWTAVLRFNESEFIFGAIATLVMAASVVSGWVARRKSKTLRWIHIVLSYLSIAFVLLHLAD